MKTNIKSLTAISTEIAALHDQFLRREADLRFIGSGGKVFYAFDNDVTTTVTAPWLDEGTHVFGPLFTNIPEAHYAFASVFAEYVFAKGSIEPFLIIPPANNELEGQWNAVLLQTTDIMQRIESHFLGLLDDTTQSISMNELGSDSDLFETIERAVQMIYGGKSPATELRRIARLAECGSLRRLDAFVGDDGFPISALPQHDTEFSRVEASWLRRLRKVRPKRESANNIDASVLATIELVNRNFVRDGEARKLCLITGDAHVFNVASDVVVEGGRTFSQEYLRRPTAFLVDKDFFQNDGLPEPSNASSETDLLAAKKLTASVGDWIREIATIQLDHSLGHDRQRSVHLVDAMEEARTSWSRFLRTAGALHSISQKEIFDIAHTHVNASKFLRMDGVRNEFNKLREQVKLTGEEAKLRFSIAGALSRFWSVDASLAKVVDRLSPIVRFDTLQIAERVASEIAVKRGEKIHELQRSKKWLLELQKEDGSQYTTMIIFSLSFATLGEWQTALNVAKAAYSIARTRRSLSPGTGIKGDESAYLCAVFSRLSALSASELDIASTWLDESYKLLSEDPIRSDTKRGLSIDNRLPAERLSIKLTRQLFLNFAPSSSDHQVAYALSREVETFQAIFDANLDLLNVGLASGSVRGRFTYLQSLINALQCALLSNIPVDFNVPKNSQVRVAAVREILDILGELQIDFQLNHEMRMRSLFCDFVILVSGAALFSDQLNKAQQIIIQERLNALPSNGSVFPYDHARRAEFLRLALK